MRIVDLTRRARHIRGVIRPNAMSFTLHTDRPGRIGEPPANEIGYPGYARVPAERAQPEHLGWILGGKPVWAGMRVVIEFPPASESPVHVARYWGACSQDGMLIFSGVLTPQMTITGGVTPQVHTDSLDDIAQAIEENLRMVVRLLTPAEAAKLKECIAMAHDEGVFDYARTPADDREALEVAVDRVSVSAHGS